jgi:hypothetical protein
MKIQAGQNLISPLARPLERRPASPDPSQDVVDLGRSGEPVEKTFNFKKAAQGGAGAFCAGAGAAAGLVLGDILSPVLGPAVGVLVGAKAMANPKYSLFQMREDDSQGLRVAKQAGNFASRAAVGTALGVSVGAATWFLGPVIGMAAGGAVGLTGGSALAGHLLK